MMRGRGAAAARARGRGRGAAAASAPAPGPVLALALALAACGGATAGSGSPPPANTAPADNAEPDAVSPERIVRAVAAGQVSIVDHIDADRGVVFVEYFVDPSEQDPRAAADGLVRAAERACSAVLADRLAALKGTLARKLASDAGIQCTGDACTVGALGEYDLDIALRFEPVADRAVLVDVVQIEGGPVTEEFRTEAKTWANQQLAQLAGGSCAP